MVKSIKVKTVTGVTSTCLILQSFSDSARNSDGIEPAEALQKGRSGMQYRKVMPQSMEVKTSKIKVEDGSLLLFRQ